MSLSSLSSIPTGFMTTSSEYYTAEQEKIGKLIEALILAQGEFQELKKDKFNTYYGSYYADLNTVISATAPSLRKHGLTIVQWAETNIAEKYITLHSRLYHKSGVFISTTPLSVPATMRAKNRDGDNRAESIVRFDAQSIVAAVTYAKRVAWQALIAVAGEEDTDGNELQDPTPEKETKKKYEPKPGKAEKASGPPPAVVPPSPFAPTKDELKEFTTRARKYSETLLPGLKVENPSEKLLRYFHRKTGVNNTKDLTREQWQSTLDALDREFARGELFGIKELLG